MAEDNRLTQTKSPEERRRAETELVGRYHEEQLRLLLERVQEGFAKLDADLLDPFELDDLIHHYERSAQKLWSFCNSGHAAGALEWDREHGEAPKDWWELGRPRSRRT